MAEALGAVTAVFSLVDITIRVIKLIREVKNGLGSLGKELEPLQKQVDLLHETSKIIEEYYSSTEPLTPSEKESRNHAETKTDLRKELSNVSSDCSAVVRELENKLAYIAGRPEGSSQESILRASPEGYQFTQKLRDFRDNSETLYRYKGAKGDLLNYRLQLETYQQALHTIQHTIAQQSRDIDSRVLKMVSDKLHAMDEYLRRLSPHEQGESLKDAGTSFAAAAQALRPPIHIRKAVSDIFTGRRVQLELLRECFMKPGPPGQRRAVIYGVGGSGKTEFCCKFVHDNIKSYWGVFFVDASTTERIDQTLKDIAEHAGCGETKKAVLYWLENLQKPWLLIIDNADDNTLNLKSLFPNCERGHILVTTRNPEFKYCSTVDHDLFHFENLDHSEATELLFKAAGKRLPWDPNIARQITNHLGNLALAVVYAGTTIRANLVELAGYLGYYKRRLDELRKTRRKLGSKHLFLDDDSNAIIRVFTTLEGCYQHLEKLSLNGSEKATDAIELLKIFAFFHNENISLDIFRRSMLGARIETNHRKKDDEKRQADPLKPQSSWYESIWRASGTVFEGLLSIGQSYLPLPQVIRAGWGDPDIENNIESYMDRIKLAMKELTHLSLVMYNEHSATYKMHPLVHEWARERPDMQFSDQRMWSDAAARVLSTSILLPPLGTDVNDDRYVVGLLPHVKHVQGRRKVLDDTAGRGHAMSWMLFPWRIHTTIIGTERIRLLAKLSLVYAKSGRFKDAEAHLAQVVGVLTAYAGEKDSRTRDAKLALSGIYFHLGQPERTAALQEEILAACRTHLGDAHPDTLRAMNRLGQARWLQGRFTEAQSLQRPAVEGMIAQLTPRHPDTLDAIDSLGMTVAKFWREQSFREAYLLHQTALAGMVEVHGREHDRTLRATQNFCRVSVMLGSRRRINEALVMMGETLEIRKTHYGEEHPMTLLAMVNAAVIRGALGDRGSLLAAKGMVQNALATAQRNFAEHATHVRHDDANATGELREDGAEDSTGVGPNHIGILFGQHVLASILAGLGEWKEARDIFAEIQEKQKGMHAHRGDYHPDRLGTLVDLARCYYELGNLDESIEICEYTIKGFEEISVEEHPITRGLRTALGALYNLKHGSVAQTAGDKISFPWILFPSVLTD